jgi:hypothetical protein
MKIVLKLIFTVTMLATFFKYSIAQPSNGIKLGSNFTFYNSNKVTNFLPKLGYQLGYVHNFDLNESFSISLEGIINQKRADVETSVKEMNLYMKGNKKAYYFSMPIGMNYFSKKIFLGTGYEFGVIITGDLPVNEKNHALFVQAGYNMQFFDLVVKYSRTLNKEPGGTLVYIPNITNQIFTPKANTLQVSLVIPLSKR